MFKAIKRFTCMALALLMLIAVPAFAEGEHGSMWIEGGEDVTLTFWIPIESGPAQYYTTLAEHPFFLWMEEQTGVHVEFIHYSWEQASQQFNLMMTSGDYYDMMYYAEYPDGPQQAITDGVFLDLNEVKDLMPNYFAAINCGDGSFGDWEWGVERAQFHQGAAPAFGPSLTTAQGNVWCVSQVWTDNVPTECGALIRKDWLDDAGLEVPTTIAELEAVLAAFAARGEDVTPMGLGNYGYNGSYYISAAFDVEPGWYTVNDDGVVEHRAWLTENGRAYLELLRDWYAKGYIDKDFMNRDSDSLNAMFLNDKLGIIPETWNAPDYLMDAYTGADEDFEVVALPPVKMAEDQVLRYKQGYDSQCCNYTVIAANSEHKEIAAQWLDRLYSKEGILRATYGVEGETYTMVDGVPYYTEYALVNMREGDCLYDTFLWPNSTGYYSNRANALMGLGEYTVEAQQTQTTTWYEASKIWAGDSNRNGIIGYVVFDGDGWAQMYDPMVEAETFFLPIVLKTIVGAEDIANYDKYVETALEMGYDVSRDRMQESYNIQHQLPADYGMAD